MEWFDKLFHWTIMVGFGTLGVLCGLLVLRVAIGVTGVLLGSTFGTLIVGFVLWRAWTRYEKRRDSEKE